jgi:hypothetical protein
MFPSYLNIFSPRELLRLRRSRQRVYSDHFIASGAKIAQYRGLVLINIKGTCKTPVIASKAKQSFKLFREGLPRRYAPRNDRNNVVGEFFRQLLTKDGLINGIPRLHSGQVPRYGGPFALSSPKGISKGNGPRLGTNGIYEMASNLDCLYFQNPFHPSGTFSPPALSEDPETPLKEAGQ